MPEARRRLFEVPSPPAVPARRDVSHARSVGRSTRARWELCRSSPARDRAARRRSSLPRQCHVPVPVAHDPPKPSAPRRDAPTDLLSAGLVTPTPGSARGSEARVGAHHLVPFHGAVPCQWHEKGCFSYQLRKKACSFPSLLAPSRSQPADASTLSICSCHPGQTSGAGRAPRADTHYPGAGRGTRKRGERHLSGAPCHGETQRLLLLPSSHLCRDGKPRHCFPSMLPPC